MKNDILYNFISPITGRIKCDNNYILLGDKDDIATPSPALMDFKLDLINIKSHYNILNKADFVVGFPNDELPNAQVLSYLTTGILKQTTGIVSIALPDEDYVTYNTFINKINNLQNQIDVIEGDIISLQAQITALELAIEAIESEIIAIEAQISEIIAEQLIQQIEIATLQSEVLAIQTQLTLIESEMAIMASNILTLQGEILAIQAELVVIESEIAALTASLIALQSEVAALASTLATLGITVTGLGAAVAFLQLQMLTKANLSDITDAINALTLNNIAIIGDLNMQGYQFYNVREPVASTDLITKLYFDSSTVNLSGAVVGTGTLNGLVLNNFAPDPIFTGGAITVPSGLKPTILTPGMLRITPAYSLTQN